MYNYDIAIDDWYQSIHMTIKTPIVRIHVLQNCDLCHDRDTYYILFYRFLFAIYFYYYYILFIVQYPMHIHT